ncbi:GNAT family N-acetyltransferase [Halomonas cerina]|uniref:Ribosomal protein S18 acetylase RimI-like enzyme n=1 Tax=Halomonas cerina TaxID=447424 RepID=A0A839VFD6_9GAMM|nr:GNAT family N-acetyltransferase [Halomonas cerina]MBB3191354.1 ribosomal protein S18 acetylase RimI-like enzyme [Halomonas cerina]
MQIRQAVKANARELAYLFSLAGEGLPEYLWSQRAKGNESPLDVGEQRARREEGGFSYRHAQICSHRGRLMGMIVDYRLPDPYPLADLTDSPSVVQPLRRLEARVPGSWYIRALATYETSRGKGVASLLMSQAEASAIAEGCDEMSLIVASENRVARVFQERRGFREVDALPVVPWPGCQTGEDWVLMTRRLGEG